MKALVAVWDGAIQAFNNPWFVPATGHAVRSFTVEVNRAAEDNPLYSHSSDFDLWFLGNFDEESGLLTGDKRLLCRAVDLKKE